jgi:uncharacterized protein YbjT (DUF2867 family)
MYPILVTGGTGTVGRELVAGLIAASAPVRVLTRDPAAARLPPGVHAVRGDLTVPETLDAALAGADAVFLLWQAPPATVAAVVERIARAARRIVFLSSPHQTPHPFFRQPNPLAAMHAEIERRIAESGLGATILRPGMFAANVRHWWGPQVRAGGVVRWPYGSVETAPVDERDVAAVAVRALLDEGHEGRDYLLTGPQALTQAGQVRIIGEVIGRPLRFEEMSPDEARREWIATAPPAIVEMLLAAWGAAVGHPALVTHTVAEVTGRPARTFREWVADHAGEFDPPRPA